MQSVYSERLLKTIARIAPGTELREGLERILRGRTGALIVLGNDKTVSQISSGGFAIHTEFSATRIRELAKMDGAIICDREATQLIHAGVQLLPDPSIPTQESGTRHRTAERVAVQTGFPVISVSASMSLISVYVDGIRYTVEDSQVLMSRANQAIQTLESYTKRLEQVLQSLSSFEIESSVTVRDVAATLQRMEMVRRICTEVGFYVLELGVSGRLIALQLEELTRPDTPDARVILRDYLPAEGTPHSEQVDVALSGLYSLDDRELVDFSMIADAIGLDGQNLDVPLYPRGYRLLSGIKSMPGAVASRIVEQFDGLQGLMSASLDDLRAVDGIGEQRARVIRESLSRMAEASLLEQFR
ncbi:DNA integrity scanning diadenylate cyclase DisA [Rothia sp. P7181]|uniref:DNA integrity scanning diadenylate cyclase DisA n=1 Tax=unclassified Rothia (in: high G+C Gram-positive bacteria) TaxID=2689056 RepID=UPI003ABF879D